MIDLHTHVLPGLDDGAPSLAVSLEMVGRAAADGVAVLAVTPHAGIDRFAWTPAAFESGLASVREAIQTAGVAVEVLAGCEAMAGPTLAESIGDGQVRTLNGSHYLLFELPFSHLPPYAERLIFDLQMAGIRPILAHGERYRAVQDDPNVLGPFLERGVLIQVSAGSLIGRGGSRVRATAEILVKHAMAHVLASDAHSADDYPCLAEGRAAIEQLVGADLAQSMTETIPAAIIRDEPVRVPPAVPYHKKSVWAFWRRQARRE